MYVFDASSIVNLVKRGVVTVFTNGVTLDLALYESINAVWKEHILLKKIDERVARDFVEIISRLFSVIEVTTIKGYEEEVYSLASREGLTVYDASYLYLAVRDKLVLVTDDYKLRDKASKYVKTLPSSKLA